MLPIRIYTTVYVLPKQALQSYTIVRIHFHFLPFHTKNNPYVENLVN